ncbi:MAG: preprotein translocase subunit SecA, partial [Oscillospiraceae bacterium]|nr:preprotein translocase subunit SecA [Oscillospiraceae bacterium]
ELIAEAAGHADTDDEALLEVRRRYAEKLERHRADTNAEAERVKSVGGLFIIGTERHESRRIDNQLRGRSGRQGDPGETRFYISMTDDIMRLFGSERILGMMDTLGIDEDTPIDQKILSNAIENAQKKVESRNFQSRKNVLEYDDVMNTQRTLIYKQRGAVLNGEDIKTSVQSMLHDVITSSVVGGEGLADEAALLEIVAPFEGVFLRKGEITLPEGGFDREALTALLLERAAAVYDAKERELGTPPGGDTPLMRELERVIMLRVVDEYWMDHIDAMEELRDGVRLRAYGQINPVDEYKREGFDMFEAMINGIKEEVVRRLFVARVQKEQPLVRRGVSKNANAGQSAGGDGSVKKQPVKKAQKIGRNEPCPCGKLRPNGLPMKYKDCCGKELL